MSATEIEELSASDNIPIIQITENGIEGFEILCRLCANKSDNLIPIYSEEGVSNELSTKMNLYLPVKVSESDSLPLQCCFQCASTVLNWHELVIASVEADKRLRDLHDEAQKHLQEQNVNFVPEIEDRTEVKEDSDDDRCTDADTKLEQDEDPFEVTPDIDIFESLEKNEKIQSKTKDKNPTPGGKFFKCKICTKVLKKSSIYRHQQICNKKVESNKDKSATFSCDICQKLFTRKFDMHKHRELFHKDATPLPQNSKRTTDNSASFLYYCEICKTDFLRKFDLLQHWQKEHKDEPPLDKYTAMEKKVKNLSKDVKEPNFTCLICDASFKSKYNFLEHCSIHDNDNLELGDVSDSELSETASPQDLDNVSVKIFELLSKSKVIGKNKIITYKCQVCLNEFYSGQEFLKHQEVHKGPEVDLNNQKLLETLQLFDSSKFISADGNITYKCVVCGTEVLDEIEFLEHNEIHSNDEKTENIDKKDVNKRQEVLKVLEDSKIIGENGKTIYKCRICHKEFLVEDWFIRHHKLHLNKGKIKTNKESSVPCDVCPKLFMRKCDMMRHRKNFHATAPKYVNQAKEVRNNILNQCEIQSDGKTLWKCDFCPKTINDKYRFIKHRDLHTKSEEALKKYICEICAKTFTHPNNLNRHIKEIHKNIKDHFCEHCGRGFKNKEVLKDHINTHTNSRPYKCDICSKSFRQKASLYIHKVFHTKDMRFSCNLCEFKCHRAAQLRVHALYHTGERPHVCKICGSSYRLQNLLKVHMYTHTSQTFSCDICKESFKQPRYLQRHKRKKHGAYKNDVIASAGSTCLEQDESKETIAHMITESSSSNE